MTFTPEPFKPSGRKLLILDIRDGVPNRKQFHSVEARKPGTAFTDDIAYFKHIGDANLFIASPDLLTACRAIMEAMNAGNNYDTMAKRAYSLARAAIAKVEGPRRDRDDEAIDWDDRPDCMP